jgi:hypothetical protein
VTEQAYDYHEPIPLIQILCYTVLSEWRRAVWQDDLMA